MKKSIIFKSLITLFSIITFVSCETEPLDPAINLADFNPNVPSSTAGAFTALVDGTSFSSTQTMGEYKITTIGNELNVTGVTTAGKIISIQLLNPAVGTFQASTTASQLVFFQYSDATLGSNGFFSSTNLTNNTSTGTITISQFNTTTNKISATFSFTAYNTTTATVTKAVTEGVINNVSFTNQVTVTPPTGIVGTYLMTAFNVSVPQDLNGDGTASTNQMNETTCFNNNTLVLNANNTFTATSKGLEIDGIGSTAVLTCFTDPSFSGTWSQSGSNVTFTYMDGGQSYSDTYVLNGTTLTYTLTDGEVVGTAGGNPVYLTANIAVVYTKQ